MADPTGRTRLIAAAVIRRVAAVRADAERGDVIGWAIMIPLSLALFLSAVQVAMWYQARNMCQAASQAGVSAGRGYTAAADAGATAANDYLARTAGTSVTSAHALEHPAATTVTVTCHAHAFTLLPLPGLTSADQSATATRERFTTPKTP